METTVAKFTRDGRLHVIIDDKVYEVPQHKEKWVESAINKGDDETLKSLLDDGHKFKKFIIKNMIEWSKLGVDVNLDSFTIKYKGIDLPFNISLYLWSMIRYDENIDVSFINFVDKVTKNPKPDVIEELLTFLTINDLPIQPDGNFYAYKSVRSDYKDDYSRRFDNSPGKTVKMKRSNCVSDSNQGCAAGLHFCGKSYFNSWNIINGRYIKVSVSPEDVVSIPSDMHFAKGRTCKYVVIEDITDEMNNDKVLEISGATKICSKCGQELGLSYFYKRKDSKDGHRGVCKDCMKK
jgi:hypothetical protein